MVKDVVKVGNPVPGRFAGEGRAKDPGGVTVAHPDLHGVYDKPTHYPGVLFRDGEAYVIA